MHVALKVDQNLKDRLWSIRSAISLLCQQWWHCWNEFGISPEPQIFTFTVTANFFRMLNPVRECMKHPIKRNSGIHWNKQYPSHQQTMCQTWAFQSTLPSISGILLTKKETISVYLAQVQWPWELPVRATMDCSVLLEQYEIWCTYTNKMVATNRDDIASAGMLYIVHVYSIVVCLRPYHILRHKTLSHILHLL